MKYYAIGRALSNVVPNGAQNTSPLIHHHICLSLIVRITAYICDSFFLSTVYITLKMTRMSERKLKINAYLVVVKTTLGKKR